MGRRKVASWLVRLHGVLTHASPKPRGTPAWGSDAC